MIEQPACRGEMDRRRRMVYASKPFESKLLCTFLPAAAGIGAAGRRRPALKKRHHDAHPQQAPNRGE
jgi:hypothetical protein